MLPIKKIYIDTKYKTPDSINNANFRIQLPSTMLMPDNAVFYVNECCIPHSWYTVETGVNDKFYFHMSLQSQPSQNLNYIVTLDSKNYTGADLAAELQTKMNDEVGQPNNTFTVTYNAAKHTISISHSNSDVIFKILTTSDIATKRNGLWVSPNYDATNAHDITGLLNLSEGTSPYYSQNTPFSTNINLQPVRNIYISSPNLGNFNTLSVSGDSSIIKKVQVTADYNQMIFDNLMATNDFLDCSKQTLKTLEFHIKDVDGNFINFHGSDVSFSIIFDLMNTNS